MALAGTVLSLALPAQGAAAKAPECVRSPGQALELCTFVRAGQAYYTLKRNGAELLAPSALGLDFAAEARAAVTGIGNVARRSHDSEWQQPWGEERLVRDRHNELRVSYASTHGARAFDVVFRLFDDGLGLRYEYRHIPAGKAVAISGERTEFNFTDHYRAWWFDAHHHANLEALYRNGRLNDVATAELPFTIERPGTFLSVHQAALVDFASMYLERRGPGRFRAALYEGPDGVAVHKTGPFTTPWRTLLVGSTPGQLADSRITLNLNEPSKIADTSWIKPMKYVGVWWEIHLGKGTWSSGPQHAANTANVKRYMDFAAKYGFGGVLVEGWNVGWDGDWSRGTAFRFDQPYPDFDTAAITRHGAALGVELIGHHETGGGTENYGRQLDTAMRYYRQHGVHSVKTGYVGDGGNYQLTGGNGEVLRESYGGQYMVNFHQRVNEAAAAQRISVVAHEPVIDTGLRRTWPNMLSREGARGQEYNAWGKPTNPPEHVTILPFTRMLAGPMDFTPGIFDLTFGKQQVEQRVQSTLANQLALFVVLYSPVQMAADIPENYEKHMDAFQFIRDVPVDWERSRTLDSVIGDYAIVARQQRGGRDWFLGAVNDETRRAVTVPLDFLDKGMRYEATIYRDAPTADFRGNPHAYEIVRQEVGAADRLALPLAPGGGTAIRFRALDR
ncbi:glycoside hydrolase family 97 protein [Pseudoduganella albidiflava]|uniref:Glycoside hydrolase family 97 protein n=1 Tax=Pseudoduganella albidiflava TaxID=321983 RepID=A0ABX5S202_9BURK|nr:glycoside hydrolase family 97 protein [Pseudoduganella albidiflava]